MTNEKFKFYGEVSFEGKDYLLTQDAYIGGTFGNDMLQMQAIALDSDFNKVFVTWVFVHEENFELEDYDYSKATSVEYI